MCYMTILSTTSGSDLTKLNSFDVVFSRELPGISEEKLLKYPNRWFIGSSQGCSCGFRHLNSCNYKDLGFSEPADWFPEELVDIEATLKLVSIFKTIISDGSNLECIDAWCGNEQGESGLFEYINCDLSEISESEFRFIENSQHEFTGIF